MAAASSTSVYLSRNPQMPGAANVDAPTAATFQFYEKTYTTGTTQVPIYAPDRGNVSVTVSFSSSTGSIEATDSSPTAIEAATAVWNTWPLGVVGATSTALLTGFTAFRANLATGASMTISVAV